MPEPKGDAEQWSRPVDVSGTLARKAQAVGTLEGEAGTATAAATAAAAAAGGAGASLEERVGGTGADLEEGLEWRRHSFSAASSAVSRGGVCAHFMHGRSPMTVDPRTPRMPGRSTSAFHHRPRRHCLLHEARSET